MKKTISSLLFSILIIAALVFPTTVMAEENPAYNLGVELLGKLSTETAFPSSGTIIPGVEAKADFGYFKAILPGFYSDRVNLSVVDVKKSDNLYSTKLSFEKDNNNYIIEAKSDFVLISTAIGNATYSCKLNMSFEGSYIFTYRREDGGADIEIVYDTRVLRILKSEEPLSPIINIVGDANCNGKVEIADAVAILQYLANPNKYPLSDLGRENADVHTPKNGVTCADALILQMYCAKSIDSLPVQVDYTPVISTTAPVTTATTTTTTATTTSSTTSVTTTTAATTTTTTVATTTTVNSAKAFAEEIGISNKEATLADVSFHSSTSTEILLKKDDFVYISVFGGCESDILSYKTLTQSSAVGIRFDGYVDQRIRFYDGDGVLVEISTSESGLIVKRDGDTFKWEIPCEYVWSFSAHTFEGTDVRYQLDSRILRLINNIWK